MNSTLEGLNKAVAFLEQSLSATSFSTSSKRKLVNAWEKENRACEEIRDALSSWNLPSLQRLDLNRALGLLFMCLDHPESSIRLTADQALDAIFRKFQLKFQLQRVIAILLTELSKKYQARAFCAALYKLSHTIHLARAQRASVYGLHFMNSMCTALVRSEESIHTAIHRTFSIIFAHIGAFVGAYVEKAEELFRVALTALELGGAANRAGCTVLAELCTYVPSILHKCFYRLSNIIFEADDIKNRFRLTGAMITFRLMWRTIVENLTEISLHVLRKLFCKVLCCLYSSYNEVVVSALEFLAVALESVTPYMALDFNPFSIEIAEYNESPSSLHRRFSSAAAANTTAAVTRKQFAEYHELGQQQQIVFEDGAEMRKFVDPLSNQIVVNNAGENEKRATSSLDNELEALSIEELDNSLNDSKNGWNSMSDVSSGGLNSLDFEGSVISEFASIAPRLVSSQVKSQIDENESYASDAKMVDPLLNCDNYLNAEEEMEIVSSGMTPTASHSGSNTPTSVSRLSDENTDGRIPFELYDDFCKGQTGSINFCTYCCLLVARRFLLNGFVAVQGDTLRDDCDVRVSHKILAFKLLTAGVLRHHKVMTSPISIYNGQQFLSDAFGFINHSDDGLVIAAVNFLLSAEKSAVLATGRPPQPVKILSLMRGPLRNRSPTQMKGILQTFCACSELLVIDEQLLSNACECAISTFECDYFLIKIARADFLASIDWCKASVHCRDFYQSHCHDVFLRQLFDVDQRVVRATCAVLSRIVLNAEFDETTRIFRFSIPDWFADSGLRKIPMVLGLDGDKYSFRCETGDSLTERSLCRVIEALCALTFENFHVNRSGFLVALAELSRAFPPAMYANAWAIVARSLNLVADAPGSAALTLHLNAHGYSFLGLLLDVANGTTLTLSDLSALTQLIAAIFAGIAENAFMYALSDQNSYSKMALMNAINSTNPNQPIHFPVNAAVLERILIFYLRIFNLYHTIVAEEKMRNFSSASSSSPMTFSVFSRTSSGIASSPAAEKLSDFAKRFSSSGADASSPSAKTSFGTRARKATNSATARQRVQNFSYLIGTGVRQNRSTSFMHSTPLRNIEPALVGAYQNFLESMNPDVHGRFLDLIESTMDGFCAIVEMLDFDVVRTFLDEILLYLRTIFDVSVSGSADCIHQFLKTIFRRNAKHISVKMLQSMRINDTVSPNDALDMYVMRSVNEFAVFTAFVSHAEYMESFVTRDFGWLSGATLQPFRASDILRVADTLRAFDPYITRLMQIYLLTNATNIRISILEVLCTLLSNDVRYEMIDNEKKFYARVVAQIRQLAAGEDVPLLGALFTFLVTLARVSYLTFADVVENLVAILARVEESNVLEILNAIHVVLLESCRLFTEIGATELTEDAKGRVQKNVKAFLCREFDFLYCQCPKAASHLWILLLNGARKFGNLDWWSEVSLDFLTYYNKFVKSKKLTTTTVSAARRALFSNQSSLRCDVRADKKPTAAVDFYGLTVILNCCEASAFRPIDQFYGCIEELFKQLQKPVRYLSDISLSPLARNAALSSCLWLASDETIILETAAKALPLIFITLCRLDEDVVMLRLSDYSTIGDGNDKASGSYEDNASVQPVEFFAVNAYNMLLRLTSCLHASHDSQWLREYGCGVESTLVFLIQILIHIMHVRKAPRIRAVLWRLLKTTFECEAEENNCSAAEARPISAQVRDLSLTFPRAHAFWFALLSAMEVHCCNGDAEQQQFYFCENYLSHTKSLICVLIMEKIGEKLAKIASQQSASDASSSIVHMSEVISNSFEGSADASKKKVVKRDDEFLTSKLIEMASDEFCARLLKWTENACVSKKLPLYVLAKLPVASVVSFSAKLRHFFVVNNIEQLLPRFTEYLRQFAVYAERGRDETKFLRNTLVNLEFTEDSSANVHRLKNEIFARKKHVLKNVQNTCPARKNSEHEKRNEFRATSAGKSSDGSQLEDDFKFCENLARNATEVSDFRKICALIHLLKRAEILSTFRQICACHRISFFAVLFESARSLAKYATVEAYVKTQHDDDTAAYDAKKTIRNRSPITAPRTDVGDDDSPLRSTSASNESAAQTPLIDALFAYLAEPSSATIVSEIMFDSASATVGDEKRGQRSPRETIYILANCAHFCQFGDAPRFDDECVERLLNDFIMFLMIQKLERKMIPTEYFIALRVYFGFDVVRKNFQNDYYLAENLGHFLMLLWEETIKKDVPRWKRLNIVRKHWNVELELAAAEASASSRKKSSTTGAQLRDEILQIFDVVQHIAHAFRNNLLARRGAEDDDDAAEVALAFKALLRLPLLAKMCVVPESALRLDWRLTISARAHIVHVPLVSIHMLSDATVLADFVWRLAWLGWTTKCQYEEFWMSLFGVLSSTPTAPDELAASAAAQTLHVQLEASCIAIEALTGLILSSMLHEQPGDTVNGRFLVKPRRRRENYLFLDTLNGKLASCTNFWLQRPASNRRQNIGETFAHNLDTITLEATAWSNPAVNYGLGQTSLDYLWTLTDLVANESLTTSAAAAASDDEEKPTTPRLLKSSVSRYLLARSTAPDTMSSLKALFDNYMHWCAVGMSALPISLLASTIKSMALLSDLIDDVFVYQIIFQKICALFVAGGGNVGSGGSSSSAATSYLDGNDCARGYAIYLLLKCASLVEWKELLNYAILPNTSSASTNFATPMKFSTEAELTKFLETVVESGLRRSQPPEAGASSNTSAVSHASGSSTTVFGASAKPPATTAIPQNSNFVGFCTLHGVLYLLQSLAVDSMGNLIAWLADFVIAELFRLQRPADILTDCSPDTIEYHKLVWTVAFRIVEDALPISSIHKTNFLKMICNLFVDPRLPTWEKQLLADGMQALIVHSNSYSAGFRLTALECFDTCQLRPTHLPFALSVYATCFYRELHEGGESAYELNKGFNGDFQKLLNIFIFYATSAQKCEVLAPVMANLICLAWAKEKIIKSIWDLIAPIGLTALRTTTKATTTTVAATATIANEQSLSELRSSCHHHHNAVAEAEVEVEDDNDDEVFADSLKRVDGSEMRKRSFDQSSYNRGGERHLCFLKFSQFDRSLLRLLYEVVVRMAATCRRSSTELCWTFFAPKLADIGAPKFAQFLAALVFCAMCVDERMRARVALLLEDDELECGEEFDALCKFFFNAFIEACEALKKGDANWTRENLLTILSRVRVEKSASSSRNYSTTSSRYSIKSTSSLTTESSRYASYDDTGGHGDDGYDARNDTAIDQRRIAAYL